MSDAARSLHRDMTMTKEYHFIQELRAQPNVVRESLKFAQDRIKSLAETFAGKIDRVVMIGCGDPYMLSVAAALAFEKWAGVETEAVEAAEFSQYRNPAMLNERTLVVLITSSGKTVKVIDGARIAHQHHAPVFALTNRVPSPITDETDNILQTQAGWSDSFPTKQTTCALALLNALALEWAKRANTYDASKLLALENELWQIPDKMQQTLQLEARMQEIANRFLDAPIYQYIGSGPNLATALLGAAKIKETSQGRAEASNVEEFAHLHGLSMKEGDPIFIVTEPGAIGERNRLIGKWILTNGGIPLVVGPTAEKAAWAGLDAEFIEVPDHDEMFGSLISLLPLQMFAHYTAIGKQRNPDRPPERGDMQYIQQVIYTSVLEGWENR
jgi:glucosamine--fructose-6-phosphate aminotransferase (isomerizing)